MAFQRKRRYTMLLWSAFLPLLFCTIKTCKCQECGGNFTNASGTITSPNFPEPYPNNLTCIYLIARPEGEVITLTFTNISLDDHLFPCLDYIEVQDGGSKNSSILGEDYFCGSILPKKQHTTQNIMRITFVSDHSVSYSGFRAIYTSTLFPYQPLLVVADAIYRLDPETEIYTPIPILSAFPFLAIALDPLDDRVYWSTSLNIKSAFLNGSDITKHYDFDLGRSSKCSGLALDYLSHLLFFADMNNGVIGLIDIPSSHVSEVLSTDLEGTSDLALDISNNVMYWTQIGTSPKIERANYDGSDRRTIVTSVDRPSAITLDLDRGYLYWVDALSGAVGRSDLEGNYSTVIYSLPDMYNALYALGLKDDMLYVIQSRIYTFSSLSFSLLYKVNTTGISARKFSFDGFRMKDMIVLDQNIVVKSPNRCDVDNGGCPYICVPKSGNASACLCSKHMSCNSNESKISACGENITSSSGIIHSPRYPKNYPNSQDCIYYIIRPKGDRITIAFQNFSLESSVFCHNDFLELRDGDQPASPILGRRYCGTLERLPVLTSTQNVVRIRLRSNAYFSNTGFLLSYTTDLTSTTTVLTTSSGLAPKPAGARKVVVNGPLVFDTNGFQKLTLTCHLEDAANVIAYSWSVPCDQTGERVCSFMPLPAKDDGKPVVCMVKYTNGQWEYGLFPVRLNYPPSLRPLISGYKDGDILKEGDRLNLTCSVAGGKPIVGSVIFSCQGYADDPDDVSDGKGKQSTVQISHVRASDSGLRCECTARWKNTDWYTLTAAIVLTLEAPASSRDKLCSESKSPVFQWAIGGSVLIILVVIIVITIIIIRRRRDKRSNDRSTIIGDDGSMAYRNLEKSELDHESASRFSNID